jgi:hypothetical protein
LSYDGRVEFSERSIRGAAIPGKSHGTTQIKVDGKIQQIERDISGKPVIK